MLWKVHVLGLLLVLLSGCGPLIAYEHVERVSDVSQIARTPAITGPRTSGALPADDEVIASASIARARVRTLDASALGEDAAGTFVAQQRAQVNLEWRAGSRTALSVGVGVFDGRDGKTTLRGLNGDGFGEPIVLQVVAGARIRLLGDDKRHLSLTLDAGINEFEVDRHVEVREEGSFTNYTKRRRWEDRVDGGPPPPPTVHRWNRDDAWTELQSFLRLSAGLGLQGYVRGAKGVGIGGGVLMRTQPFADHHTQVREVCSGWIGSGSPEYDSSGETADDVPWLDTTTVTSFWMVLDYTVGPATFFLEAWLNNSPDRAAVARTQPSGGRLGVRFTL